MALSTVRGGQMPFNPCISLAAPGPGALRGTLCMCLCMCSFACAHVHMCGRVCACVHMCLHMCMYECGRSCADTSSQVILRGRGSLVLILRLGTLRHREALLCAQSCFAGKWQQNQVFKLRQADSTAFLLQLRNCLVRVPLPTTMYCPGSFDAEDKASVQESFPASCSHFQTHAPGSQVGMN